MKKEQLLAARVMDKVKVYEKTGRVVTTTFLDPSEKVEILSFISKLPNYFFGGFENAEREILIIGTAEKEVAREFLTLITIEANDKNIVFSHRDVLGSILGLGLKREMVGDILLKENRADVIVLKEMETYLLQNLERIGREKVSVRRNSWENLLAVEDKAKEWRTTIPSLRADALISAGLGVSRDVSAKLIQNQKVKLNYKPLENVAKKVNAGDKISIRGYGRLELLEILGETRKDRIRVVLKRY